MTIRSRKNKMNEFVIKFGMDSNEIDINTLISNLMYTSDLIQEINRELNTEKKITVNIKALEKGSFEIHIQLIESLIESLFSKENVEYTAAIIGVVSGIYGFVQFLKGNKPKKIIENKNDTTEITNINGDVKIIQKNIVNIYNNNPKIRQTVSKQFTTIDKNREINQFQIIDSSNNILTDLDVKDFEFMKKNIESEKIKEEEITTANNQRLHIIRPSFSKDLTWDFIYNNTRISAKMNDEDLIKIIDKEESFSKGDVMIANLEIKKFYDDELQLYILNQKNSYKIIKFIRIEKKEQQTKLF